MIYNIAVDSGKSRTKVVGVLGNEFVQTEFPTRVREVAFGKTESEEDILTLNGVHTVVGSENGTNDFRVLSKASDTHVRSTYYGISEIVPNASKIALAIGTPLSTFTNPEEMKRYRKVMLNYSEEDINNSEVEATFPHTISFEVNGEPFEYTVERLEIFPESTGYLMLNEEMHADDDVLAVIDIGGLNVNASLYQRDIEGNFRPLTPKEHETSNLGIRTLVYDIRAALSRHLSTNVTFDDAEIALARGYYGINPKIREETTQIIKKEREKHVQKIAENLEGLQWDFMNTPVAFIGGGSIVLQEEIQNHPSFEYATFSQSGNEDNVRGFLGVLLYEKEKKGNS